MTVLFKTYHVCNGDAGSKDEQTVKQCDETQVASRKDYQGGEQLDESCKTGFEDIALRSVLSNFLSGFIWLFCLLFFSIFVSVLLGSLAVL